MIEEGVFTQNEYDAYLKMKDESNNVNLGYAFVTFSHTDETKFALLMSQELKVKEGYLDVFLKGVIDHGDMDPQWTFNKMRNDS